MTHLITWLGCLRYTAVANVQFCRKLAEVPWPDLGMGRVLSDVVALLFQFSE